MISPNKIKQIRMKEELYNLVKTEIDYEGIKINIYDKERMLIDLARNKNQIGYDLYKEIISNYRKLANSLVLYSLTSAIVSNLFLARKFSSANIIVFFFFVCNTLVLVLADRF